MNNSSRVFPMLLNVVAVIVLLLLIVISSYTLYTLTNIQTSYDRLAEQTDQLTQQVNNLETQLGAVTTTTSTATQPYITLTSPWPDDKLVEGETYILTWESEGVNNVAIDAAIGGKSKGHIISPGDNVAAALGSFSWTVPEGYVSGFGPSEAVVSINIYDPDNPDVFELVENAFTVIAPAN